MLRARNAPKTLNVKTDQRVSVALVYLTLALLAAGFRSPPVWIAAMATAVAVTLLNLDFYRYFHARRGMVFVIACMPLHWLYFLYCGVSVAAGTVLHYLERPGKRPCTP